MAGDGLIWAGIGKGIADAGSTMGQFLFKDLMAQEDRAYKAASRKEELAMRLEDRERDRELRREIAASKDSSGGGGQGGLKAEDYAPGGKLAGMVAGKMGMTEPEYAQYYSSRKTGDFSAFEKEETTFGDFGEEQKVKRLPPQFREFFNSKTKALADIEESYALGGKFDDVAKGRRTEFGTETAKGVLAGNINAGKGGQAVAVSEAKPLVNVEGGMQYNQYTGDSKVTPVGQSQITENVAQAGQAGALSKKYGKEIEKIDAEIAGGAFNKNSSEKLTSMINSANATIKSLTEGSKGTTPEAKAAWQRQYDDAIAVRDKATALQKGSLDARDTNKPPPKPEPAAKPDAAAKAEKAPSIGEVQGAPAGASIGIRTEKGWEVKDKSGNLIGYVRGKK
jgi:hypothetical protein